MNRRDAACIGPIFTSLFRFFQVVRHLEMMLQRRKRLSGPIPQVWVLAALGIALEQRNCVLVRAELHRIEIRTEFLAALALELV